LKNTYYQGTPLDISAESSALTNYLSEQTLQELEAVVRTKNSTDLEMVKKNLCNQDMMDEIGMVVFANHLPAECSIDIEIIT